MRSWGTSVRSPPSQTPVGLLRLAFEDDHRCGELPFAGCFRHLPVPQSSPSSLSLRLAAPRFRRYLLNSNGYPRHSLFRSSITRLSHSLSTLRSLPSRSRGRSATQDSLPAGGQPLPGEGRYPARFQMKFQPRLHGFLLIQAFATQSTAELCGTSSATHRSFSRRVSGIVSRPRDDARR